MATPSNLWGDEWRKLPHRAQVGDRVLSRRRARRMSRRFAGVGVGIPAVRLQEIAAGAPIAFEELMDVRFALTATEIKRAERLAKFERRRRVWIRFLIVAVLILAALNLLLCMAYVFIGLVLHEAPF
ncbi:hypothetical protein [Mycobacterium xenopi]|nr:hypothetical protein [Mycobacterium xenopi]EID15327.1 hypothetical protein MXEN_06831 [Mycobacterium xenopi RIVM700367]MDA3641783.1 hypothetical protein [Mycobacterium xenopi]MDA3659887.1 hypothetical protein [Mycobacterium xenopi]MDA3664006.1 hypothetical protein [Mycobacterium xenopi]ORX21055.1 hypothetical protein AWC32_02480 [Mycobacterium xenopi]